MEALVNEFDDILAKIREMSIEDLTILGSELTAIIRERAGAELERKERELNELRVLAGLKKKPIKSSAPPKPPAPPVEGAPRRGRPRKVRE
jgi:hypothetical protein